MDSGGLCKNKIVGKDNKIELTMNMIKSITLVVITASLVSCNIKKKTKQKEKDPI